jgi:hypothetical protein
MATNKQADYDKIVKLLKIGRFLTETAPAIVDGNDCPQVVVDAIRRFTRVFVGREASRIDLDEATHKKLEKLIDSPAITSMVGPDQTNLKQDILTVQNLLRRAGYLEAEEIAKVGPQTQAAINKFQEDHKAAIGIDAPTGKVGQKTMTVLVAEAKKKDAEN